MRRSFVLAIAAAVCVAAPALAQTPASGALLPDWPKWDIGGNAGLRWFNPRWVGVNANFDYLDEDPELRLALGRYWTQHLKTEVAVTRPLRFDTSDSVLIPASVVPGGAVASVVETTRVIILEPTVTYQFLENVFAHPYLSAGVALQWLHTTRDQREVQKLVNGIIYIVPGEESTASSVHGAPFVSGGAKSYFNRRVYARPEVAVSMDGRGAAHFALRLGVGVDF
jgi:hypothetical protein